MKITADMISKRVRVGASRAELQFVKWITEGRVKGFSEYSLTHGEQRYRLRDMMVSHMSAHRLCEKGWHREQVFVPDGKRFSVRFFLEVTVWIF